VKLNRLALLPGMIACQSRSNEQATEEHRASERGREGDGIAETAGGWRFGRNPSDCLVDDPRRAGLFAQFAR
jgi:hypothetical protein